MGRKRTKHTDLPRYMHFYRNAYYYKRSDVRIRLGSDRKTAFMKYGEITSSSNPNKTFADIAVRYRLEVLTLKRKSSQKTESYSLDEVIKVFGNMFPQDLRPSDIYQYMDIRSKTSVSMANKGVAALSNLCNSAIRWGLLDANPCKMVKKISESPRERLIKPEELEAFKATCPESLSDAIDLAYITGARRSELLSIKLSDIKNDGLLIFDSKNSKQFIIKWSEKLKSTVEKIQSHGKNKKFASYFLLTTAKGKPFDPESFSKSWYCYMQKAVKKKILQEKFTFHDIRAMAVTSANNKHGLEAAQKLAGHASSSVTKRVYIRGTTTREPLE